MKKTYVICIEIFNANDAEYKALRKFMKKQGFKKTGDRGKFWEISKTMKADHDLYEINDYIKDLLSKIDHSKVRVTTELPNPND